MKFTLFTGVGCLVCHIACVNAGLIWTSANGPSNSKDEDALRPIILEVASNGIIAPQNSGHGSKEVSSLNGRHFSDLEHMPVILPKDENQYDEDTTEDTASDQRDHDSYHLVHHHGEKNNPFRTGGLILGHGPVVQPHHVTHTTAPASNMSSQNIGARYLVIPLTHFGRKLASSGFPVPNHPTAPEDSSVDTSPAGSPRADNSTLDKSHIDTDEAHPRNSLVRKSVETQTPSDPSLRKGNLPTIPQCLDLLEPLRDLAKRLVFVEEAPHHTLVSACHFNALNQTSFNGYHVERMRNLCWDLFETIQQEGRRRWERCLLSTDEKVLHSAEDPEDDRILESKNGLSKLSFRAYQLGPDQVKGFIADHPDLSPDDVEWLTHDIESSDATSSPNGSTSNISKRSWIGDLIKAIFSAEVDTTVKQLGKGVGEMVVDGVIKAHDKDAHDEDKAPNHHNTPSPKTTPKPGLPKIKPEHKAKPEHEQNREHNAMPEHEENREHKAKPEHEAKPEHAKRDAQSNRVYVHGQYYPIAPINKYVNHPRATVEPFTVEDIDSYLEFVRETRHLSRKQMKKLRAAVERELKLYAHSNRSAEIRDGAHTEYLNHIQSREVHHPNNEKRAGQPPRLGPGYRRPYQWDFPHNLGTNPAYIDLKLAWNNTVTASQKEWIALQLRHVWVLRVGDLCNISRSWTNNLSEESQEIELKFKGLSLERCKEIREGNRGNWRVGDYWRSLEDGEHMTTDESEGASPTLETYSTDI